MKRILKSDWVLRIVGGLVLVGIVLFAYGIVLKVTVPPQPLLAFSVQSDRVAVSFETTAQSQRSLGSFFDRMGISGKDYISGFEIGLDASSSATLAAFPYQRFSFFNDDRRLVFQSKEHYPYSVNTSLWEGTRYVPKDSLVYYGGPVSDLRFVWKLTDRQIKWFDEVSASSPGFFSGGVMDTAGRGSAFAVLTLNATESASLSLEKLKEVPFETSTGVFGYSEKESEGTRFYMGFVNAALVNKALILADNADTLERVSRVVKGEAPSYEMSSSGMPDKGVRVFHITNPSRITKLSDGPLFLAFNAYGNVSIPESVSQFVLAETNSGLWGQLLLH